MARRRTQRKSWVPQSRTYAVGSWALGALPHFMAYLAQHFATKYSVWAQKIKRPGLSLLKTAVRFHWWDQNHHIRWLISCRTLPVWIIGCCKVIGQPTSLSEGSSIYDRSTIYTLVWTDHLACPRCSSAIGWVWTAAVKQVPLVTRPNCHF